MALTAEAEFDAVMTEAFPGHAVAYTGGVQEVDSGLFQDTCADALLGVTARAELYDDGVNARKMKQMREHEAGGSCSENPYLSAECFHSASPFSSSEKRSDASWKAELAAGTPQ